MLERERELGGMAEGEGEKASSRLRAQHGATSVIKPLILNSGPCSSANIALTISLSSYYRWPHVRPCMTIVKNIEKGVELSDKCSLCSRGHSQNPAVRDHGLQGLPTGEMKNSGFSSTIPWTCYQQAISVREVMSCNEVHCECGWVYRHVCVLRKVCAIYLFIWLGERQRERKRANPKETPRPVRSPTWGLIPGTGDHDLSWCFTNWAIHVPLDLNNFCILQRVYF